MTPIPSHPNTFRISVGDFTESLIIQIWNAVYDYTIPFILDEELLGTGTLVTVDQATGVLTARHVASEIFKKCQGKPGSQTGFYRTRPPGVDFAD